MRLLANELSPKPKRRVLKVEWHPIHSVIAVALGRARSTIAGAGEEEGGKGGVKVKQIIFYTKEGKPIKNVAITRGDRSHVVTVMKWHPRIYVLAIGWNDGTISVWNHSDELLREDFLAHSEKKVVALEWSPGHKRYTIVSCDSEGVVALWHVDERGKLNAIIQYASTPSPIRNVTVLGEHDSYVGVLCNGPAGELKYVDSMGGESGIYKLIEEAESDSDVIRAVYASPAEESAESGAERDETTMTYDVFVLTSDFRSYEIKMDVGPSKAGDDTLSAIFHMHQEVEICAGAAEDSGNRMKSVICCNDLILIVNSEPFIRVWNLRTKTHYLITLQNEFGRFSAIQWAPQLNRIIVGTMEGVVYVFQFIGEGCKTSTSPDDWILVAEAHAGTHVETISIGKFEGKEGALVATKGGVVSALFEFVCLSKMVRGGTVALLHQDKSTFVIREWRGGHVRLSTPPTVAGVDILPPHVLYWDGHRIRLHDFSDAVKDEDVRDLVAPVWEGAVSHNTACLASHDRFIVSKDEVTLEVYDVRGEMSQVLAIDEEYGEVKHVFASDHRCYVVQDRDVRNMDSHGDDDKMLVNGALSTFEWAKEELVNVGTPRMLLRQQAARNSIDTVNVNAGRTCLSFTVRHSRVGQRSEERAIIHVYDVEKDKIHSHRVDPLGAPIEAHCWDRTDNRMLCVLIDNSKALNRARDNPRSRYSLHILFVDMRLDDIYLYQKMDAPRSLSMLLSVDFPYLFYAGSSSLGLAAVSSLERIVIKELEDLKDTELTDDMRKMFLDFFFFVAADRIEEALRRMHHVKNKSIWRSLVVVCIKRKRLDLTRICLERLEDSIGAMILRQTRDMDVNTQVAEIAVHFNLHDFATAVMKEHNLHSLYLNYLENLGRWEEAIDHATNEARIHLKSTYHKYGEYCMKQGRIFEALKCFFNSRVGKYEYHLLVSQILAYVSPVYLSCEYSATISRILLEHFSLEECESVMDKLQVPEEDRLKVKFEIADSLEASGRLEDALEVAKLIGCRYIMVRVLLKLGREEEAVAEAELEGENGEKAAYVLAQHYEAVGNRDMIKFYRKANQNLYAIKLAMKLGLTTELAPLTLLAPRSITIQLADYLLSHEMFSNAVQVCVRGERLADAVNICIKHELEEEMDIVTEEFSVQHGVQLITKWTNYLISRGRAFEAVDLLAKCQHLEQAVRMAEEMDISLTNDLTSKLTPPEGHPSRDRIIYALAELCKKNGHFITAANFLIKVDEYVAAAESLIAGGETDILINFAKSSRKKEVYNLAAEYLKSLKWHEEPWIMKTIITFYSKAKMYSELSEFFENCANMEILNYKNLGNAMNAMKEAYKWAKRVRGDSGKRAKRLELRIRDIAERVSINKLIASSPSDGILKCEQLLEKGSNMPVEFIKAKICEGCVLHHDWKRARKYLKELEDANRLNEVPSNVVEEIYRNIAAT